MNMDNSVSNTAKNATSVCPVCGGSTHYDFSGRDLMFDLRQPYDYYCCTTCSAVSQHPMPDMATISTFYPPNYCVYDEQARSRQISALRLAILRRTRGYSQLQVPWLPRLIANIAAPLMPADTPAFVADGRLLDVGCGNGRYLSTMRALGWQVQGVEFSEEGVRVCQMADLPVHHGDLKSAHFPDAAFDLITVRHVIEHIPEPHSFVAELSRILKPSGTLVIETPNVQALGRPWFGANWYANDVPRHLILFSPRSLALLAQQHGLECAEVVMDTTPKIILNSIDYALGNAGTPSKKISWRRLLARLYVRLAKRQLRGDTLRVSMRKP